ncbi:MAG: nodulation protein NfeD [Acidilobaceae archaeon]
MRYLFLIIIVSLTILYLNTGIASAEGGDLGSAYCGVVEKNQGIIGRDAPYDRVAGPSAIIIRVEGVISSWTYQYIIRSIREAESRNVPLVLELNTPGGLADAATDIVLAISRSRVPVIGYVVDKWAESAGTLILVSTHIAAMQEGTIIGSLQPVSYDPTTGRYAPINETKILNPIIKTLCEHGASKGRNATALVRFVLHNDNYGAREAKRFNVIDIIANSREDLLNQVNGLVVQVYGGDRVKLELNGKYEFIGLNPSELLISMLSDPLISGILLSIGVLALIFSIASANMPGVALGLLIVILGLLGTGLNPNIASLALIALGALLIAIEIFTPGFGIIGGTGIIMLVLGLILLPAVPGPEGFAITERYLNQVIIYIYALGLTAGITTAFIVYKILQVRRAKPYIWRIEGLRGEAIEEIRPGKPGFVIVEGEYWKAISDEEIKSGDKIEVISKDNHTLKVRKLKESK